jgi:predicted DNA-binding mobile mystery protein A
MKTGTEFKGLRRRQLDRSLSSFDAAKTPVRPPQGWLRSIRESLVLTLTDVGKKVGMPRQRVQQLELAEAGDKITLKNLRLVADAMGCKLVYAIVPKSGTLTELADKLERDRIVRDVGRVARTMALEDQATDNTDELIESKIKSRRQAP